MFCSNNKILKNSNILRLAIAHLKNNGNEEWCSKREMKEKRAKEKRQRNDAGKKAGKVNRIGGNGRRHYSGRENLEVSLA